MKLLSLELENIRSYRKLDISFPSGSILFRGDMGSGKSTILMAVEFALFGSSYLLKHLVSKKEQKGEVVLRFDVDGITYEIGRVIYIKNNRPSQSSKESYIMVDGVKEPLAISDLRSRVLEILGFNELANSRADSRVYRYAVYVPQEEIKSIIESKDREEIIRQAFSMEDYNTSIDNIKKIIKNMKHTNEKTAIRFERLDEYVARVQEKHTLLAELNNKISQYVSSESKLTEQQKSVQLNMNENRSKMDEIIGLRKERDQLKTAISDDEKIKMSYYDDINKQRLELDKLDVALAQYDDIKPPTTKSISDINTALTLVRKRESIRNTAVEKSKEIQQKLKTIRDQLKDHNMAEISDMILSLESKIDSNNLQLSNIRDNRTTMNHELGALNQQARTLTESLRRASTLGSRCDVCESELDPARILKLKTARQSKLDDTKSKIATANNSIKEAQSQISTIIEQIQHDTEHLSKYKVMEQTTIEEMRLEGELKTVSANLNFITPDDYAVDGFLVESGESAYEYLHRLYNALLKYNRDMDILAEKYKTKAALETNLENAQRSYKETTSKIKLKQNRLDTVISKISESDMVEEQYNLMYKQKLELDNEIKTIAEKKSATNERIILTTNEINTLDSDIITAKGYKTQYDLYNDSIEWLERYYIRSVMIIDRKTKLSLRHDFDQFYRKWYTMLIDDPTKSSIIDEQFGPIIYQDDYDIPIDGLSGGEKTSVALAYRLALNSTIRRQTNILKSNLLILDEPTDGFSRHQMENVRTIFESLRCEQIIMVSHEAEMEGYVDHVFRVTKTEGLSSIQQM